MKNKINKFIHLVILFNICGLVYVLCELGFDQSSHPSMYALGGLCGILIGLLNEYGLKWETPLWKQVLYGECIVLPLEFITGIILHKIINIQPPVWDYSGLWLAEYFFNQSSPLFALIFVPVILLAIFVDDYYRWIFMKEDKPRYKLF